MENNTNTNINPDSNDVNNKPEGETKPAEVKKPNVFKRGWTKVTGVAKLAAPVAAKVAVIGGAAGAAAVAVVHAVRGDTDEILERIDELKDVVTEKGGDVVESVKDSIE